MTTKAVAERLGHSDERTLISTYNHATTTMEERAAAECDRFNRYKPRTRSRSKRAYIFVSIPHRYVQNPKSLALKAFATSPLLSSPHLVENEKSEFVGKSTPSSTKLLFSLKNKVSSIPRSFYAIGDRRHVTLYLFFLRYQCHTSCKSRSSREVSE